MLCMLWMIIIINHQITDIKIKETIASYVHINLGKLLKVPVMFWRISLQVLVYQVSISHAPEFRGKYVRTIFVLTYYVHTYNY